MARLNLLNRLFRTFLTLRLCLFDWRLLIFDPQRFFVFPFLKEPPCIGYLDLRVLMDFVAHGPKEIIAILMDIPKKLALRSGRLPMSPEALDLYRGIPF